MRRMSNSVVVIGLCLIGFLGLYGFSALQGAQASQARITATASRTRTAKTQRSTPTPIRPTRTPPGGRRTPLPTRTPNTTPVADLIDLPATPITNPPSKQLQFPPSDQAWVSFDRALFTLAERPVRYTIPDISIKAVSPNGKYIVSTTGARGFDVYDAEKVRSYRFIYKVETRVFSRTSSELAIIVNMDRGNWALLILNLDDGILRQAANSFQWPKHTNSKSVHLVSWNDAGILMKVIDLEAENPIGGFELFHPDSLQFETIQIDGIEQAATSHNGRFVVVSSKREYTSIKDLLLIDREDNSQYHIAEASSSFDRDDPFSSDDRYFVYIHRSQDERQKGLLRLIATDTKASKELLLDTTILQGGFPSVAWYGKDQLLLSINDTDKVRYFLLPIKDFDHDHLTPLATIPYARPQSAPRILYLP